MEKHEKSIIIVRQRGRESNREWNEKTKSKLGKSLENGFTRKSASNFSDLFLDEAPHQISIKKTLL